MKAHSSFLAVLLLVLSRCALSQDSVEVANLKAELAAMKAQMLTQSSGQATASVASPEVVAAAKNEAAMAAGLAAAAEVSERSRDAAATATSADSGDGTLSTLDIQSIISRHTYQAFLSAQASPGLGGAINQTSEHLVPALAEHRLAGARTLNGTAALIRSSLEGYLPKERVPAVAGFLIYGLVFIPLFLTFWCLASVQAAFKLRPTLMFIHSYFALVAGLTALTAATIVLDPLTAFQQQDPAAYLFVQLGLGVLYAAYVLMQMAAFAQSRNNCEWCVRLLQLAGIIVVGSLYYELAWTPAMHDKPPVAVSANLAVPYLLPTVVFAIVARMEHLQAASITDPEERALDVMDTIRITVDASGSVTEHAPPLVPDGPKEE